MLLEQRLRELSELPLSGQTLQALLHGYSRPYDKIVELVKEEKLVQLRRGMYIVGPAITDRQPERYVIANHLYGPSYVTAESVLSFRGWIPERVFQVVSVTTERSKKYRNKTGEYIYRHLPMPYYGLGIVQCPITDRQRALMASDEKALCDLIVLTKGVNLRSVRQTQQYLTEDLRIDSDHLTDMDTEAIQQWIPVSPKRESLQFLIKTIRSL